jgi:hypothetical protein
MVYRVLIPEYTDRRRRPWRQPAARRQQTAPAHQGDRGRVGVLVIFVHANEVIHAHAQRPGYPLRGLRRDVSPYPTLKLGQGGMSHMRHPR